MMIGTHVSVEKYKARLLRPLFQVSSTFSSHVSLFTPESISDSLRARVGRDGELLILWLLQARPKWHVVMKAAC